jgi:ABC-type Fe3+/spermidine/putrescine transport system ATPase subunit
LALADRVAVMKEGGIAQLGTPEEIFQSPNSAFVAEFVGFDNFLRGRVRLSNADELLFEPDGWDQPLVARANPQLRAGDRAQVAFRSASLRIATNSVIEATNTLRARLLQTQYLGEYFQGDVEIAGSQLVGRFAGHPGPLARGVVRGEAIVSIALDATDVVALPLEESASQQVAGAAR